MFEKAGRVWQAVMNKESLGSKQSRADTQGKKIAMEAQETLLIFRRHHRIFLIANFIFFFFSGFFKTGRKTRKLKSVLTIQPDKYWPVLSPYFMQSCCGGNSPLIHPVREKQNLHPKQGRAPRIKALWDVNNSFFFNFQYTSV